jgi:hypothetical protein
VEEQLVLLGLLLFRQVGVDRLGLREAGRELKHGLVGAGKGVALLAEKNVYAISSLFSLVLASIAVYSSDD